MTSPQVSAAESGTETPSAATRAATYWDVADIQFHCRLGRSAAWRLVKRTGFPAPVVLSKREVFWPRDEVIAFLECYRDPDHYSACDPQPNRTATPAFTTRRRGGRQG